MPVSGAKKFKAASNSYVPIGRVKVSVEEGNGAQFHILSLICVALLLMNT